MEPPDGWIFENKLRHRICADCQKLFKNPLSIMIREEIPIPGDFPHHLYLCFRCAKKSLKSGQRSWYEIKEL